MRDRRDVTDQSKIETDYLKRTDGRFATCARAFDQDLDFLKSVAHRLPGSVLSDQLGRIRRAFARTFESNLARARPPDHVAIQIRDRADRVVEGRVNVGDAAVNVFGTFGLNNFRRFD